MTETMRHPVRVDEPALHAFFTKLREEIPLTAHMGFEQFHYDLKSLSITAALAPNHNDKGTAFAGSLSATANLCGWGLITLLLEELTEELAEELLEERAEESAQESAADRLDRAFDVVIRDSRLEYFLPVTRDFTVTAEFAADADIDSFVEKLKAKGKARMDVVVTVMEGGELCFRLSGAYVALKKKQWL